MTDELPYMLFIIVYILFIVVQLACVMYCPLVRTCAVFAWNIVLSSAVTFVLHCMDGSASVHPRVVLLVV